MKDRLGSGHEYLVEWGDHTSAIQHLTCIFGKYSKQKTLQVGDCVIGCPDEDTLDYFPGIIRAITAGKLEIEFVNETRFATLILVKLTSVTSSTCFNGKLIHFQEFFFEIRFLIK